MSHSETQNRLCAQIRHRNCCILNQTAGCNMKPLFLTIFYTLVVVLFDSGVNQAVGQTVTPPAVNISGADYRQGVVDQIQAQEKERKIKACNDEIKEAQTARKKLTEACATIGKTKCTEIAIACATTNNTEQSSDSLGFMSSLFGQQFSSKVDFNSTCENANMTLTQWEKDKEKAQSNLEKKKEKLADLQKDAQKASEDANKAKQKMEENAHNMEEDFNKLQKQLEEAGDKEEAEALKQARENASRLRELVSKNLAMTQVKSVKLQERASMLATMSDALIQTDCLEKVQKFIREFNGSRRGSIVSGGANSAFSASNTSGSTAQAKWQACLAAAYGQRDATLKKYQNEVQSIDQAMNHLNEEYRSAQKAIQEGEQLRYKSKARRENEKAQAQNLYQQRRQKLITDAMTAIQEAQNKTQQLQSQMTTTQNEISKLSNQLASLDSKKPGGDKTYRDAVRAADDLIDQLEVAHGKCSCASSADKDLIDSCNVIKDMKEKINALFNREEYQKEAGIGADKED